MTRMSPGLTDLLATLAGSDVELVEAGGRLMLPVLEATLARLVR